MIKTLMQLIDDRIALEYQRAGKAVKRDDLVLALASQVYARVRNDSTADRSYFKPGTPDKLAGVEIVTEEAIADCPDPYFIALMTREVLK